MKSGHTRCDSQGCNGKIQAVCFTCNKLYCFKCSITRAYETTKNHHNIM